MWFSPFLGVGLVFFLVTFTLVRDTDKWKEEEQAAKMGKGATHPIQYGNMGNPFVLFLLSEGSWVGCRYPFSPWSKGKMETPWKPIRQRIPISHQSRSPFLARSFGTPIS